MSIVNPKIDLVFKKLFGTEQNNQLLKSLVNSILPKDEQVVTLELKNPYNPSDYINGKITYLDIKATDENGKWYDIEIQVAPYDFFGMRLLFYWAKLYAAQLKSGQTYDDLRKTIVISLIDFNYFKDPKGQEKYHRRIGLCDLDTKEVYEQTDGLELQFVELKKFKMELPDVHSTLERWITFINKAHEYTKDNLPKELANDENIKSAMEQLEVMYFNDVEKEHYESQEKKYLDKLSYEKQDKLRQEQVQQNLEKAEQKAEIKKSMQIAKQMKLANEPIDKIIRFTGLTKDQIDKL
jgi:predicted transposase/invertase (TIGR01784 family)